MPRIGSSGTGGANSGGGSGTVTGIPPTTIDAITRWDDTTGTTIKNSPGTLVQDSGAIEAQGFITNRVVSGTVTVQATETWISPSLEIAAGGVVVLAAGAQVIVI